MSAHVDDTNRDNPSQQTVTHAACRAEIERLHLEIRGLNGQVEGMTRTLAGLHARLAKATQHASGT
jgi:predicted RNase H-like nuclease (RuvC/YqgF family)